MAKTKILAWDIEATNLAADFGIVITVGFKEVGTGRARVLRIDDYYSKPGDLLKGERKMLQEVTKELLDSDIWVTHYGTHYDIGFINARLLYHHLPVLPNHPHVDTWKISRNRLRLSSNRLKTLSTFLKTKDDKNAILAEHWIGALSGSRRAVDYIVEHCRRDVFVLEEVYQRLRPLANNHPHVHGPCPVCGLGPLHRRGFRITRTRRYPRFQCQACGAWPSGKEWEKLEGPVAEA